MVLALPYSSSGRIKVAGGGVETNEKFPSCGDNLRLFSAAILRRSDIRTQVQM
jgi:hypothetical protein